MRNGKSGRAPAAAVLVALCMLSAAGAPARASALGPWRQLASSGLSDISEVGLARTQDGILHAAWTAQQTASTESVLTAPISRGGSVGAAQAIVSGWASAEDPALGLAPAGGLQAFFGGIHTLAPNDPNAEMSLANSGDGGGSWSLVPAPVVAPGASAYASPAAVSSSSAAQSSPLETWYGTSGVWVHAGTDPATPNSNFQQALGGCCGYYSNLAGDGGGSTELAWYSNATGHYGIWAQQVGIDGAPAGSPSQMPGTANMGVGEMQRTPLVARPQGGFYVAYPTGYPSFTAVRLWRIGGGVLRVTSLHSTGGSPSAGAAVDAAGRIWVFWSADVNDRPQLFAVRSNPAVTRFGAVVRAGAPSAATSAYAVDGNASAGALDLFTTFSRGGGSGSSEIWTRHIYPGLSVALAPRTVRARHAVRVVITVTDAGVPVKGARVRLAGQAARTDSTGRATIRLRPSGSASALASRAGYVSGTAVLQAKS